MFTREIGEMSGPDAIAKFKETMTTTEEHTEHHDDSGRFLPLSAWAPQGFDVEAIRLHPPQGPGESSGLG